MSTDIREKTELRELTAHELDAVAGGRKAGEGQKDFLDVKLTAGQVASELMSFVVRAAVAR